MPGFGTIKMWSNKCSIKLFPQLKRKQLFRKAICCLTLQHGFLLWLSNFSLSSTITPRSTTSSTRGILVPSHLKTGSGDIFPITIALYLSWFLLISFSSIRGLGQFRNSQQAFAKGVKIPWPFAFFAVRHMAICGKLVNYISADKQFDVASAISNFKKILSKNISLFRRVKTES